MTPSEQAGERQRAFCNRVCSDRLQEAARRYGQTQRELDAFHDATGTEPGRAFLVTAILVGVSMLMATAIVAVGLMH